jgi:antitoxin VapB
MPLSIKHPDADKLARELAAHTGESLTQAVIEALRERLIREKGKARVPRISEEMRRIGLRCAALPVVDDRAADEILGYDDRGLPG